MAEIVAGAAHADIFHGLDGERFVGHVNATHAAQALAEHVIAKDQ
jgi:hypothetical protein